MTDDNDKKFSVWSEYTDDDKAAMERLAAGYIDFISRCKTERESVIETVKRAEAVGYKNLDDVIKSGTKLKAGDKVYSVCMKKTVALFQIGTEPLENGLKILGAHIDTCRLRTFDGLNDRFTLGLAAADKVDVARRQSLHCGFVVVGVFAPHGKFLVGVFGHFTLLLCKLNFFPHAQFGFELGNLRGQSLIIHQAD